MTYTINAKNGTPSFSVVDGSVNTDLDISLIGKGYVGYGSALNTNFLRLLENFADTTGNEPTKAITGQLFYNTSTQQLLVYNGSTFARVTPRDTSYNTLSIGTINYDTTSISGTVFNGNISVTANGLGVVNINRLAIQTVSPNKILGTAANGMITGTSLQYNSINDTLQIQGGIGIGTTVSNDYKLDANGTVRFSGAKYANGISGANQVLVTNGLAQGEVAALSMYSTFTGTSDNQPRRTADITAGYNGGAWGYEYLSLNVGKGVQNDAANTLTERVRITGDGSVGIGTTSPNTAGGTINLVTASSGTTIVKSQTSSVTTGVARYDLATGTPNSYTVISLHDNTAAPYFQLSSGSGVLNHYYDGPNHIFRNVAGTVSTTINASGITVTGNVVTTGGVYWANGTSFSSGAATSGLPGGSNTNIQYNNNGNLAGSSSFVYNANGNVGIGTSTPDSRLTVQRASGSNIKPDIASSDGVQYTYINSNTSQGAFNSLVAAGDHSIIYSDGTIDSGALTIGPWSNSKKGIRINSSGYVGIGTGSPTNNLHVSSSSATTIPIGQFRVSADVSQLDILAYPSAQAEYGMWVANDVGMYTLSPLNISTGSSAPIRFGTTTAASNPIERMRIDANGNIGIGTINPGWKLEVAGAGLFRNDTNNHILLGNDGGNMELCRSGGGAYIDFKNLASKDYDARIQCGDTTGTLQFFAGFNSPERMRINSSNGNVGIGVTSVDYKLHVAGDIAATNNIIGYYSDDRLKTRLGVIENAVDKVSQLTGFYYEANQTAQDLGYTVKREVGISAQDVQKVLPEVVMPAPIDSQYLTVDYDRIVPLLIEAIKELKAEINQLKGQ